jgi:hypothetical protein
VWPPIQEKQREGAKYEWTRQLDRIAKTMGTPRLTSLVLTEDTVPESGKWVLKREFSADSEHVEIVDLDGKTKREIKAMAPIQQALKDSKHKWIIQTYAHMLQQWGEWRVFLIGGKVRYIILTARAEGDRKDKWEWNKVDYLFSLSKLTWVQTTLMLGITTNQY